MSRSGDAASDGYWEASPAVMAPQRANHHPGRAMGVAYWRSPEQVSAGVAEAQVGAIKALAAALDRLAEAVENPRS